MDICGIFVGDSNISYGSMRSSLYRDYEQFPYGTLENNKSSPFKDSYSKVKEKSEMVRGQKYGKKSCPFCKENKKRPLITYLRRRDFKQNNEKICEEDEEQENSDCYIEEHYHSKQQVTQTKKEVEHKQNK